MKEVSAHQIAAAVAGRPGSPEPELRLLMLFPSDAPHRATVESRAEQDTTRLKAA